MRTRRRGRHTDRAAARVVRLGRAFQSMENCHYYDVCHAVSWPGLSRTRRCSTSSPASDAKRSQEANIPTRNSKFILKFGDIQAQQPLLCLRLKPGPVAMQVFDGIWMFAGPFRILDFLSSDVQQASTVSFVIQDSSWYPETVLEKIHTLPFDRKVYFSCLSTESADACFCQRISFLLSILNVHFMEQVSALYLRHFPQQLRNWDSSSSLSSARGSGLYIAFNRKFK